MTAYTIKNYATKMADFWIQRSSHFLLRLTGSKITLDATWIHLVTLMWKIHHGVDYTKKSLFLKLVGLTTEPL